MSKYKLNVLLLEIRFWPTMHETSSLQRLLWNFKTNRFWPGLLMLPGKGKWHHLCDNLTTLVTKIQFFLKICYL